jgi:ribonuclease VapC
MVIDTSALIAILSDEPEAPGIEAAIEADSVRLLSAASLVEASIVIESRYGEAGGRELDLLIREAGMAQAPPSPHQQRTPPAITTTFPRKRPPLGLRAPTLWSQLPRATSPATPALARAASASRS